MAVDKSRDEMLLEAAIAMGELEEIRHLEDELRSFEKFEKWRRDPIAWLEERFGESAKSFLWSIYGPEYDNHKWDGDKDPLALAWYALADGYWAGVQSATGTGKTYALARVTYWFLDCFPNSLVVTSAPKKEQLSLHLWSEISRSFAKFKRIRPYSELLTLKLRVDARKQENEDSDENSHMAVGFIAGIKANEESTTKAQGFHREHMLIITEETPGMPLPTLNAFENTSTGGHNLILAVGNPDSITDPLNQFIENYSKKVKAIRISGYDHPNVVLGSEVIPGAVSQPSIDNRRQKHGEDHYFYKSRVRGICPRQHNESIIKYDWIMQCVLGSSEYKSAGAISRDASRNAVGIDVANSDDGDKAATAYGSGNTLQEVCEFQCPNSNHLAYNVLYDSKKIAELGALNYHIPTIVDYSISEENVGVDPVGVGAGTINTFSEEGWTVQSLQGGQDKAYLPMEYKINPKTQEEEEVPVYEFNSWRSQAIYKLADDLQHRRIIIDIKKDALKQFIMEALQPRYKHQGHKISVEPKPEIKKRMGGKSPNIFDAIVNWNWVRENYDSNTGELPFVI